MRLGCGALLLLALLGCKKDVRSRECAALLSRVEAINRASVEFGVANKEDGGTLVDLWRGFAGFARADAQTPVQSTDANVVRLEKRVIDVRARSVAAFTHLAAAKEHDDEREEATANEEVRKLGDEWKEIQDALRAGCP